MRILVVAGRHPFPPRRGDQLRALQCGAALARRHQVTILAPEAAPGEGAETPADLPFRVETYAPRRRVLPLGLAGALGAGLPFQTAFYSYPDLGRRLGELRRDADLVVLQLVRLTAFAPVLRGLPLVVDLVDSLSLNLRSRARRDRAWARAPLALEAALVERAERDLLEQSRCGLVVSDRDRAYLMERLPVAGARLRTVPIAVEPYLGGAAARARGQRESLVFSGNLGYFPNQDALRWFLDRVWPRLRRERPRVRLVCAGARPGSSLRRAIARAGAELLEQPSDLRAVVAAATVAVAPLQCGSGLPIKVLEAWSAGTPVVASSWAAAGVEGEGALEVADAPERWLDVVSGLLDSPQRRADLAEAGRARLLERYSRATVERGFLEAVEPGATGSGS